MCDHAALDWNIHLAKRPSALLALREQAATLGRPKWPGTEGGPLDNSQQDTGASTLQPTDLNQWFSNLSVHRNKQGSLAEIRACPRGSY